MGREETELLALGLALGLGVPLAASFLSNDSRASVNQLARSGLVASLVCIPVGFFLLPRVGATATAAALTGVGFLTTQHGLTRGA